MWGGGQSCRGESSLYAPRPRGAPWTTCWRGGGSGRDIRALGASGVMPRNGWRQLLDMGRVLQRRRQPEPQQPGSHALRPAVVHPPLGGQKQCARRPWPGLTQRHSRPAPWPPRSPARCCPAPPVRQLGGLPYGFTADFSQATSYGLGLGGAGGLDELGGGAAGVAGAGGAGVGVDGALPGFSSQADGFLLSQGFSETQFLDAATGEYYGAFGGAATQVGGIV